MWFPNWIPTSDSESQGGVQVDPLPTVIPDSADALQVLA